VGNEDIDMVGTVGAVKMIQKPDPNTLTEALSLLSALGGKGETKNYLEEMLDVQLNNETVFKQATQAVADYNKIKADVEFAEDKFKRESVASEVLLDKRSDDLTIKEKNLNVRVSAFESSLAVGRKEIEDYKNDLRKRDISIAKREDVCSKLENEIRDRLNKLENDEKSVQGLRRQLEEKYARVRAELDR